MTDDLELLIAEIARHQAQHHHCSLAEATRQIRTPVAEACEEYRAAISPYDDERSLCGWLLARPRLISAASCDALVDLPFATHALNLPAIRLPRPRPQVAHSARREQTTWQAAFLVAADLLDDRRSFVGVDQECRRRSLRCGGDGFEVGQLARPCQLARIRRAGATAQPSAHGLF